MGTAAGNWYFPNETRIPSTGDNWDFHRTRGLMAVLLQRRRGGELESTAVIYLGKRSFIFFMLECIQLVLVSVLRGELSNNAIFH